MTEPAAWEALPASCPSCGTAWPDLPPAHHLALNVEPGYRSVAACGSGEPVPATGSLEAIVGTQLAESMALSAATVLQERVIGLPVVGEEPRMTGFLDVLGFDGPADEQPVSAP